MMCGRFLVCWCLGDWKRIPAQGDFCYSIHCENVTPREAAALFGNLVEIPSPGPHHRPTQQGIRGTRMET